MLFRVPFQVLATNMSVARLNMKGRKPNWSIFMSSKHFSGKKPGNTWKTVATTSTCLAYTSWASWPNMYRTKKTTERSRQAEPYRQPARNRNGNRIGYSYDCRIAWIFQHETDFPHSWNLCRGTVWRHYRTGFLCQHESASLPVRTENKAKGKDTGMLSDFPDEGAVARAG